MGFGTKFRTADRGLLRRKVTAPSGASPEAIWHEFYDSQTYTSAATTRLTFFNNTNADATLSNMPSSGQLPDPQYFSMYDLTLDFLPATSYVSTAAGGIAGKLDDFGRILMVGRPTWTLILSDKRYGPYSLTLLHGTGAIQGFGWGTFTAEESLQFAHNNLGAGWNYHGSLIIPPKNNFSIEVNWAAAQTLTEGNPVLRLGIHGILSRRVL